MAAIDLEPVLQMAGCAHGPWTALQVGPESANSLQTNNFAPTKLSIVPVQRHKVQLLWSSGAALVKLDIDHCMFFVMGVSEKEHKSTVI